MGQDQGGYGLKAQVLHAVGDIRYEETPAPVAGPGEVLIAVRAAGICGSDVPRVFETGAHRMPLIPGHEFSGVVENAGEGVDISWTGKPVGVFPLIPCGKCEQCRQGHHELCRQYDYVGSRRDGAFAEFVTVPAANLLELPREVSLEEAAMLEPMAVAVHAMRRGMKAAGRSELSGLRVAVCGAGTIGLLLSMFLRDAGAEELFLIGNKETQRTRAQAIGLPAENFCSSRETDASAWLRERTAGGADLVFECVGKSETCAMTVELAAPMGTVVLMGNPYGEMSLSRDTYWKILRNQLTLTGTWNSSFGDAADDWRYVLERLKAGTVHPAQLITQRLALSDLERGLKIMRDKTEDYCKIMIVAG